MKSLKRLFKKLLFDLNAKNLGLLNAIYRWTFNPKPGTLFDLMNQFSKRYKPVRFIQVGANDGYFHDPLHRVIRMFGWQGVLLEPQPDVYENYLRKLHDSTPNIHTVNAALSYTDGQCEMFKIGFSNSRWATGLTSFRREALESAITSGHVERLATRYGEQLPENKSDYIKKVTIQSISPDTLLKTYELEKVDWVQIDAEGFDFEIIKMLNIDRTRPTVIVYENSHLSKEDQQSCISLLKSNDYEIMNIRENTVAMKKPLGDFNAFFTEKL